ncbi:MAG: hypothetical protein LWX56_06895 [Ignavibacteria bacterium]|nr:hypothetical protein [Ignavibacteria bacterium]
MEALSGTVIIIALYGIFGASHSWLASEKTKKLIIQKHPGFLPYYRISYNIFALGSFYALLKATPFIDIKLYDIPAPFDLLVLIPQIFSILGVIYTFRYFDLQEFLGISQLERHFKLETTESEQDEISTFTTTGPFRWCRHPLYFFCIISCVCRPYMFLHYGISIGCIILYFIIGSKLEEKSMIEKFGWRYEHYSRVVPAFIPRIRALKNH